MATAIEGIQTKGTFRSVLPKSRFKTDSNKKIAKRSGTSNPITIIFFSRHRLTGVDFMAIYSFKRIAGLATGGSLVQ
jgi:hypothetical protein